MLYKILLFLLVVDSFVLLAAILMQAGQGGGLAATFGGSSSSAESIFGSRQTGNLLTRASWWSGGLFLALAFMLSLATTRGSSPASVLDNAFQNPPASAPAPLSSGETTGVVPLQTAPTTTQPAAPAKKTPPPDSKKP
jgi:preprotein translocase subunit SecG